MLHALSPTILEDESRAHEIWELSKGPFYPLSADQEQIISQTSVGRFFLCEVKGIEEVFAQGRLPLDRLSAAKRLLKRIKFGVPGIPNWYLRKNKIKQQAVGEAILKIFDEITDDQDKFHRGEQLFYLTDNQLFSLVRAYWLKSAVSASILKMWHPQEYGYGVLFSPSEGYKQNLTQAISANLFERHSLISFYLEVRLIVEGDFYKIRKKGECFPLIVPELKRIVEIILDKFFSLNTRFYENGSIPLQDDGSRVVLWLGVLFVYEIFNKKFSLEQELAKNLHLCTKTLDKMIEFTKGNLPQDRGVMINDGVVHYGKAQFPHVCQIYHSMIAALEDNEAHGITRASNWFEQIYAQKVLSECFDGDSRYIVMRGGNSIPSDYKYDIDKIIYDKESENLFFIQIKYKYKRLEYYWGGAFLEFFGHFDSNKKLKPSAIWSGIRQLIETRRAIIDEDKKICDQIKNILIKNNIPKTAFIHKKCHYILLHTYPNFDFCEVGGVALYDFNTFRNLVRGGNFGWEGDLKSGKTAKVRVKQRSLPLQSPDQVFRIVAEEMEAAAQKEGLPGIQIQRDLFISSNFVFGIPYHLERFHFFGRPWLKEKMCAWIPVS